MRQLMHGNGCSRRAGMVEIFSPHFVVTAKIVHVDEVACDFYAVGERCAFGCEDVANVLDDCAGLRADIEVGRAHRVDFNAGKQVVFSPRASAGNEQKIPGAFDVRKLAAWHGFGFERGGGHGVRGAFSLVVKGVYRASVNRIFTVQLFSEMHIESGVRLIIAYSRLVIKRSPSLYEMGV